MSASLIVLIPVILLGIVGTLCFVGCILDTKGLPPDPFFTYSDDTVLANNTLAGFWPLNDQNVGDKEPAEAVDLMSGNNGKFIDPTTTPSLYPWLDVSFKNPPGADVESAAAAAGTPDEGTGKIAFAQTGIVKGDLTPPASHPVPPACMVVNGCYVEVPFSDKFAAAPSFTAEAWVRVDWTATDPHAWRVVLDMRDFSTTSAGYAIYAKADDNQPTVYHWGAILGDGTAAFKILDSTGPAITLRDPAAAAGTVYYLALTYNGSTKKLTLYVNVGEQKTMDSTTSEYVANTTQPLWIGAGAPYLPRRPQPANVLASPLFPFVGAIQDVAIYKDELTSGTIGIHFDNGNGLNP